MSFTLEQEKNEQPVNVKQNSFCVFLIFFLSAVSAASRRAAGASSSLHGALLHHALLPEAAVSRFSHLHLLWQLALQAWLRRVTPGLHFFRTENK